MQLLLAPAEIFLIPRCVPRSVESSMYSGNPYESWVFFHNRLGFDTEKAIINALQRSSRWKPAKANGNAVTSVIKLPIEFKKS